MAPTKPKSHIAHMKARDNNHWQISRNLLIWFRNLLHFRVGFIMLQNGPVGTGIPVHPFNSNPNPIYALTLNWISSVVNSNWSTGRFESTRSCGFSKVIQTKDMTLKHSSFQVPQCASVYQIMVVSTPPRLALILLFPCQMFVIYRSRYAS